MDTPPYDWDELYELDRKREEAEWREFIRWSCICAFCFLALIALVVALICYFVL